MDLRRQSVCAVALVLSLTAACGVAGRRGGSSGEVTLSSAEFSKLETFEAHAINKADKVFSQGNYDRAYAEYDSFILTFGKSKAVPYALLRKARCLHLSGKRFRAIKEYE